MSAEVRRRSWIAAAGAGAVLFVLFQWFGNAVRGYIDTSSLFYWWGYQWSNRGSDTEHGWLVLGLSGWLLVRGVRREARGARTENGAEPQGDSLMPAVAAIGGGLALHAVGFIGQQTRVSIFGFLLCAWGVLRLGGGWRWGAAAAFPLGFMVFAIPINALDSIGFWLRVWVVDASGAIARGCGIAVLQSGTQLVAPDGTYNYDVAAACSGIRSLTAMTALSLLAGYLNFRSKWRRALVVLLCFPLVYVGNVARILAIIFAAEAGGPKWGDIAHVAMGFGVFGIVLGGVLAAIAALRRVAPEREEGQGTRARDEGPETGAMAAREEGGRPVLVAGIVSALAVGEMFGLAWVARLPPRGEVGVALAPGGKDPVELPTFLGVEWTGQPQKVSDAELEILPGDTGYSRKLYFNHRDPAKQVFLSIVLSGKDRSSIHRPELCLVGQGWTIDEAREVRFALPERVGDGFPATLLRVQREVQTVQGKRVLPQVVAYWFVGGDRVVPSHWKRVLLDAWDRVMRARADRWAYVLMQTDATDGEAQALARLQAVLDGTLPAFQRNVAGGEAGRW